jgi:hypothetical protein
VPGGPLVRRVAFSAWVMRSWMACSAWRTGCAQAVVEQDGAPTVTVIVSPGEVCHSRQVPAELLGQVPPDLDRDRLRLEVGGDRPVVAGYLLGVRCRKPPAPVKREAARSLRTANTTTNKVRLTGSPRPVRLLRLGFGDAARGNRPGRPGGKIRSIIPNPARPREPGRHPAQRGSRRTRPAPQGRKASHRRRGILYRCLAPCHQLPGIHPGHGRIDDASRTGAVPP